MSLARHLMDLFVVRDDAWVVARAGRYRAVTGRLALSTVEAHLRGETSLQVYALSPEGEKNAVARWGAFDLDAHGGEPGSLLPLALDLQGALSGRVGHDRVLVEETGGEGLHVWALLGRAHPAGEVAFLMDQALREVGLSPASRNDLGDGLAVERYPKRAEISGRVGSALGLPLGCHSRSGRRSRLVDPKTGDALGAEAVLSRVEPVSLLPRTPPLAPPILPARADRNGAGRVACPDAWATYLWAVRELGLEGRTARPGAGDAFSVRCLSPDGHRHEDRSGQGSAHVIRRGHRQLYGCNVCDAGRAYDTLELIRRVRPRALFVVVLGLARAIDPGCAP